MTSSGRSFESKRIVLVEDDPDVRHSLTMLLRARGFTVDVYRSGIELLSNRHLPDADCMLIDYKMPRLDGLELIKRLRQAGSTIPALLITGFFSNTLNTRALEAGFNGIVEKPSIGDSLISEIAEILG